MNCYHAMDLESHYKTTKIGTVTYQNVCNCCGSAYLGTSERCVMINNGIGVIMGDASNIMEDTQKEVEKVQLGDNIITLILTKVQDEL